MAPVYLPVELWQVILSHLPPKLKLRTIANLSQCSKGLTTQLRPFLFRHVSFQCLPPIDAVRYWPVIDKNRAAYESVQLFFYQRVRSLVLGTIRDPSLALHTEGLELMTAERWYKFIYDCRRSNGQARHMIPKDLGSASNVVQEDREIAEIIETLPISPEKIDYWKRALEVGVNRIDAMLAVLLVSLGSLKCLEIAEHIASGKCMSIVLSELAGKTTSKGLTILGNLKLLEVECDSKGVWDISRSIIPCLKIPDSLTHLSGHMLHTLPEAILTNTVRPPLGRCHLRFLELRDSSIDTRVLNSFLELCTSLQTFILDHVCFELSRGFGAEYFMDIIQALSPAQKTLEQVYLSYLDIKDISNHAFPLYDIYPLNFQGFSKLKDLFVTINFLRKKDRIRLGNVNFLTREYRGITAVPSSIIEDSRKSLPQRLPRSLETLHILGIITMEYTDQLISSIEEVLQCRETNFPRLREIEFDDRFEHQSQASIMQKLNDEATRQGIKITHRYSGRKKKLWTEKIFRM